MVEVRGQLDDHRRGPAPEPIGRFGHAQGIEVQLGGAERLGVGRVGRFRAGILLVGADVDQRLPQRRVALGVAQAGRGLVLEPVEPVARLGRDAGGVVLDLLHRRQGRAPADRVVGLVAGLVEQGRGPAQQPLHGRGARLPLVRDVGERQAAQGGHRQQARPPGPSCGAGGTAPRRRGPASSAGRSAARASSRLGAASSRGPSAARASSAARAAPARPPGTTTAARPRPPASRGRSSGSAARQARARAEQLGVGAAGVQPGEGVGQVAARGLALDLAGTAAGEGGPAGEDLAEDRAQGEDVGPLVHPIDLAARLLRRHVGRRAHHAAGLRQVRIRAAAGRGDDRLLHRPCRPSASSLAPPRGRTLARPQSITCTSPKLPTITFDGFRSRWITPRACA